MTRELRESSNATDMGEVPDLEALSRLIDWDGLNVVDVGCGAGMLARGLADLGADVLGLEPSPQQVALNAASSPQKGVELIEGKAESIPRPDGSADVVIFSRSLHHVPREAMDGAIVEATRVLKPETGRLVVIEPDMAGTFSQLVKPFHDETVVRAAALDTLARVADPAFETVREVWFTFVMVYDDFDALVARMTGSTFNSISAADIDTPEVRAAFEAGAVEGGYQFTNPNRTRIYAGRRA